MFGIEDLEKRFFDYVWRTDRKLLDHNKKLVEQKDQLKSVQSTNDKRYNEIDSKFRSIQSTLEFVNNLVRCDKCHCLLEKSDAIKGESRIKTVGGTWVTIGGWTGESYGFGGKEEIEEVYYCHKCSGLSKMREANEKVGNKKARPTMVKTNKK